MHWLYAGEKPFNCSSVLIEIYMDLTKLIHTFSWHVLSNTKCASAAPGSFQMLEQGRARTFCQRNSPDVNSAVASCPVDCMHYVSFDELKELEIARDVGVADDHRHFGHSSARGYIPPTPLHISRRDSDANHKSSFYQYVCPYSAETHSFTSYLTLASSFVPI